MGRRALNVGRDAVCHTDSSWPPAGLQMPCLYTLVSSAGQLVLIPQVLWAMVSTRVHLAVPSWPCVTGSRLPSAGRGEWTDLIPTSPKTSLLARAPHRLCGDTCRGCLRPHGQRPRRLPASGGQHWEIAGVLSSPVAEPCPASQQTPRPRRWKSLRPCGWGATGSSTRRPAAPRAFFSVYRPRAAQGKDKGATSRHAGPEHEEPQDSGVTSRTAMRPEARCSDSAQAPQAVPAEYPGAHVLRHRLNVNRGRSPSLRRMVSLGRRVYTSNTGRHGSKDRAAGARQHREERNNRVAAWKYCWFVQK